MAVDNILNVTTPVAIPSYIDHDIDGEGYQQWVYAVQWWLDRMVDSPKPMQEKMTWFWHGHFCSSWDKVNSAWAMLNQNRLFRDSGLGNFRAMTHAMAIQPAMLFYLDNLDNVKSSPNQNFARELMELFTIGVVDRTAYPTTPRTTSPPLPGRGRATASTGTPTSTSSGAGDHDYGPKTFMGVRAATGTAPTSSTTSCRRTPPRSCRRASSSPRSCGSTSPTRTRPRTSSTNWPRCCHNDFAIKPWVKAMLMHDEFYTQTAMEGLGEVARRLHRLAVPLTPAIAVRTLNPQWYVEGMGQVPFAPPNVAGWKTNAYWVNTSVFGARAEFARGVTWRMRTTTAMRWAAGAPRRRRSTSPPRCSG
jgi:uncharacterized protein (DUF1800 family)